MVKLSRHEHVGEARHDLLRRVACLIKGPAVGTYAVRCVQTVATSAATLMMSMPSLSVS